MEIKKIIWIIKKFSFFIYLIIWKIFLAFFLLFSKPNPKSSKIYILFTGQYYNGNLKSLYEAFKKINFFCGRKIEIGWVVKNKSKIKRFQNEGVNALWFYSLRYLPRFFRANILLNDRGMADIPIPKIKNTLWVQVWHGIPFKGFAGNINTKNFFNSFDINTVSSEWLKDYYIHEIGVDADKVFVTGYQRIDRLIGNYYNRNDIIRSLSLNPKEKIFLYAPTWEHESGKEKPLFPFKENLRFIKKLTLFLEKEKIQMIIRLHPNYRFVNSGILDLINNTNRIIINSVREEWDTEKFLYISDVLITDWSSIANDFIVLNRPIIFLEIPINLFEYGFALKPEDRAGYIVKKESEFFSSFIDSIKNPKRHEKERQKLIKKIHFRLDSKSSQRTIELIEKIYKDKILNLYAR